MNFSVSIAFLALSIYSVPSPQVVGVAYKFNNPDFNISPQSIPDINAQPENNLAASIKDSTSPKPQEGSSLKLNFIGFDRSPSFNAPNVTNDNNQQGVQFFDSVPEKVDVEEFKVQN